MDKKQEQLIEAMKYETFVRRAHSCGKQSRYGALYEYMHNLMKLETDESFKHTRSREDQFDKVRKYIERAFNKFLRQKLSEDERSDLTILKHQLPSASDSADLMKVVNEGLASTDRFSS